MTAIQNDTATPEKILNQWAANIQEIKKGAVKDSQWKDVFSDPNVTLETQTQQLSAWINQNQYFKAQADAKKAALDAAAALTDPAVIRQAMDAQNKWMEENPNKPLPAEWQIPQGLQTACVKFYQDKAVSDAQAREVQEVLTRHHLTTDISKVGTKGPDGVVWQDLMDADSDRFAELLTDSTVIGNDTLSKALTSLRDTVVKFQTTKAEIRTINANSDKAAIEAAAKLIDVGKVVEDFNKANNTHYTITDMAAGGSLEKLYDFAVAQKGPDGKSLYVGDQLVALTTIGQGYQNAVTNDLNITKSRQEIQLNNFAIAMTDRFGSGLGHFGMADLRAYMSGPVLGTDSVPAQKAQAAPSRGPLPSPGN